MRVLAQSQRRFYLVETEGGRGVVVNVPDRTVSREMSLAAWQSMGARRWVQAEEGSRTSRLALSLAEGGNKKKSLTQKADNCGTGAGGFQGGNDCAEGHGRPEAGTEKVRTGKVTEEEQAAYDKFVRREEVDDQGRNSVKAWNEGDDWTGPDGFTFEHDKLDESIGERGMGEKLHEFTKDGGQLMVISNPKFDEDRQNNRDIMSQFDTDVRELDIEDQELIEAFTANEFSVMNEIMRQDGWSYTQDVEKSNDEVGSLAWDAGAIDGFDALGMSDEETLNFARNNPEFTEKIKRAAQGFHDDVLSIQHEAENSRVVYRGGNHYQGIGEAAEFSSGVADAASALTMRNAEKNPDRYREALDDFITNFDEFDRPYERGLEEVMDGYRMAGNHLDGLVTRQLRSDGKPMTVYRGVTVKGVGRKRLLDAINSGVKTYKLDGMASTTTDGVFAQNWPTGHYPILMKMNVTEGLFVQPISTNAGESEIIIPKGTELNIKNVQRISTKNEQGNHMTYTLVEMEEVGLE